MSYLKIHVEYDHFSPLRLPNPCDKLPPPVAQIAVTASSSVPLLPSALFPAQQTVRSGPQMQASLLDLNSSGAHLPQADKLRVRRPPCPRYSRASPACFLAPTPWRCSFSKGPGTLPARGAAFAVAAALKASRVAPPCQASGVSEMSPPPSGFPPSPYLSCSPAAYTVLFFSSAPTPPAQETRRRADGLFPSLLPWEFVMVGGAVRSLVPGLLQKQVIHKYWRNEQIRTGRPRAPGEPPDRASQAAWSGSGAQRRLRAEEPPSSG